MNSVDHVQSFFPSAFLHRSRAPAALVGSVAEPSIVVKMEQWRCEMSKAFEEVAQDSDDELQEMFLTTIHQDSSDSDEEVKRRRRGGSRMGREFVHMDRELWHGHLVRDYFAPTPTFDHVKFRRRFRMRREHG